MSMQVFYKYSGVLKSETTSVNASVYFVQLNALNFHYKSYYQQNNV